MSTKVQIGAALAVAVFVGGVAVATQNPGLYILAGLALASAAGLAAFSRNGK